MSVLTVTNATLTTSPANSVQIDNNFAAVVAWAAGNVGADNITAGAITQTELAAAGFNGTIAANVADDNVIGGLPVVHRIDIADGAGNTDVTLTYKTRVIDAWVVKTGAAGSATDTIQVLNSASAITDAMALTTNDTDITRAGKINDANHEIAASGTLRITAVNNTNNQCTVYVLGIRVA